MGIKEQTEDKMRSAIEHLKTELQGIRTGRANPAMVANVRVNIYGSEMRLQDIANITASESRKLHIMPYDHNTTQAIAKGIQESNIGFMPNVDGNNIWLNIPAMDDNLRKKMIKMISEFCEKTKIVIRNERQNGNKLVRKQKADGDIGEDVVNKTEKDIQTLTDKYCKMADELCGVKEKEVSSV